MENAHQREFHIDGASMFDRAPVMSVQYCFPCYGGITPYVMCPKPSKIHPGILVGLASSRNDRQKEISPSKAGLTQQPSYPRGRLLSYDTPVAACASRRGTTSNPPRTPLYHMYNYDDTRWYYMILVCMIPQVWYDMIHVWGSRSKAQEVWYVWCDTQQQQHRRAAVCGTI